MGQTILEMKNIKKSFSGIYALKGINFDLKEGEVHALLGENGAGKSTLIKIMGGIYQPDEGSILIKGKEVKIDNIQTAQNYGIGIIHQEIVLVPYLSIADNIFLGREPTTKMGLKDIKKINQEATKMIAALGLNMDVHRLVGSLSIAEQQMVEIVKAISFDVKILVMDEPTSSLSDAEVVKLFEIVKRLTVKNVSIIYISHRMEELFQISDRVTVIRDGTYIGTKMTSETNSDELISMMVGRSLNSFYIRTPSVQEDEVLSVHNLNKKGVFQNVNFTVHKGEILGFSGLMGAGRSEIMTSIFGGNPYDSGEIFFNGKPVTIKNTKQAINFGMAMVPEDRKKQGLILINSVGFNIVLVGLKFLMKGPFFSKKLKLQMISKYMKDLNIKAVNSKIAVSNLSGGNQQKVVLAKWLASKPKLLILDEPTRGIDVGAKQEIYSIINKLANEGMAIIMISSELPEIINMCDSVCVVRSGEIVMQLDHNELSQENIMKYATGGVTQDGEKA